MAPIGETMCNGYAREMRNTLSTIPLFAAYTQVYRSVFGAGHLLQEYRIGIRMCVCGDVRCAPNKQSLDTKYFTMEYKVYGMDGRCALPHKHTHTHSHTHFAHLATTTKTYLSPKCRVAYVKNERCFQLEIFEVRLECFEFEFLGNFVH